MTAPLVIYIAGPLSAATPALVRRNVEAALEAGLAILGRGHAPVIPHLNHWFEAWHHRTHGDTLTYEQYLAWDFAILRRCDALLYLAPSPGADRELAMAESLGLAIFRSVDDVPWMEV